MYSVYTILVLVLHWFVMTLWLAVSSADNNFCGENKLYDFLFYSIFGAVYIFTQVVLVDGPTFYKYVIFYAVLFLENTVANIVWIFNADDDVKGTYYFKPIIFLNVLPFFMGIVFMILYYKTCHPSTGFSGRNKHQSSSIVNNEEQPVNRENNR